MRGGPGRSQYEDTLRQLATPQQQLERGFVSDDSYVAHNLDGGDFGVAQAVNYVAPGGAVSNMAVTASNPVNTIAFSGAALANLIKK